jgi:sensor domain CHASE-containing protein/nitrogen-specific signal transduction histidine kinase
LNIRIKTIVILALICVGVCGSILITSQIMLINSFARIEQDDTAGNVQRVVNTISTEISNLDTINVNGWAGWDDTYDFIVDNNTAYIESNLVDWTFQQGGINCMLFINSSGQLVYGKAFDLQNDMQVPLAQDFLGLVTNQPSLWNFSSISDYSRGIVLLAQDPMIISSRPILTSAGLGPLRGALIMGEFITPEKLHDFSSQVQLPLTLETFNDPALPSDFQLAHSSLSSQVPIWVNPLNGTVVAGYALLFDVFQNPIFMIRADMPRNVFVQGQTTVNYFLLSSFLWTIVFVGIVMLLLEKTVLSRVLSLSKKVSLIGNTEQTSARVPIQGNDEITKLATSINNMLTEIENKSIKLRSTERLATLGELTTAIAHDLRNPMQGINAAAYYLKTKIRSTADEKTSKMLTLIEKDIKYSDRIIQQLLEYSEPIWLEFDDTTIGEIVKEALCQVRIPEKIQVVNEVNDPKNGDHKQKIRIDKQKIRAVFGHMIENAVEAMPNGGILKIGSTQLKSNVIFTLSDTGIGMSKEQLGKVWSPLFTTKAKGMGLSLASCKRVVEAHGGKISVESIKEKGTTFSLTIPTRLEPSFHQSASE